MHTGDVGYMTDDGFIYIVDRLKDMIITGGENVYSTDVENIIMSCPGVTGCAVIGIPSVEFAAGLPMSGAGKTLKTVLRGGVLAQPRTQDILMGERAMMIYLYRGASL